MKKSDISFCIDRLQKLYVLLEDTIKSIESPNIEKAIEFEQYIEDIRTCVNKKIK